MHQASTASELQPELPQQAASKQPSCLPHHQGPAAFKQPEQSQAAYASSEGSPLPCRSLHGDARQQRLASRALLQQPGRPAACRQLSLPGERLACMLSTVGPAGLAHAYLWAIHVTAHCSSRVIELPAGTSGCLGRAGCGMPVLPVMPALARACQHAVTCQCAVSSRVPLTQHLSALSIVLAHCRCPKMRPWSPGCCHRSAWLPCAGHWTSLRAGLPEQPLHAAAAAHSAASGVQTGCSTPSCCTLTSRQCWSRGPSSFLGGGLPWVWSLKQWTELLRCYRSRC